MVKTVTLTLSAEELETLKNAANLFATIRAAQEDCQEDGTVFAFGNTPEEIEIIKKATSYISKDISAVTANM